MRVALNAEDLVRKLHVGAHKIKCNGGFESNPPRWVVGSISDRGFTDLHCVSGAQGVYQRMVLPCKGGG